MRLRHAGNGVASGSQSRAALDNRIDAVVRAPSGVSSGLLLSGSLFVIVLAYAIRFMGVALCALEAGFERLSPNLDAGSPHAGRDGRVGVMARAHATPGTGTVPALYRH